MRRLPPLNALRAFEATARLSSVTAAAQELGVTHSAISQQVRQLEDYMGRRLFHRPGRRVEPTTAGRALLQDVTAAFDQIANASERLTHRGARRILTVKAPPCFALRWLVPRIVDFQRQHQGLELRVDTSASDSAGRPDRIHDVVICREESNWPGYLCRPLLDDRRVVVIGSQLADHYSLARPADLNQLTLLQTRPASNEWQRWFERYGESAHNTPEGPVFDDLTLALEAAFTGLGAVIAPLALVEKDLLQGRLVAPFPELALPGGAFYLLCRRDDAAQRGPRELLRWLEREAATPATIARAPANPIDEKHGARHALN